MNVIKVIFAGAFLTLVVSTFAVSASAESPRDYHDGSGTGSADRFRADTPEECHPYPIVNGECKWPEGPDGGDSDGGGDAGPGDSGPAAGDSGEGDSGEGDSGEGDSGEGDGGEGEGSPQ